MTPYSYTDFATEMGLLVAAVSFIVGLKWMSGPKTAVRGNKVAAFGMTLGGLITLADPGVTDYAPILGVAVAGGLIGLIMAKRVAMTSMPQMVGLFNGFGGTASVFVAGGEFYKNVWSHSTPDTLAIVTTGASVLIGSVTLTGSLIAVGKLQGTITSAPVLWPGQRFITGLLGIGVIAGVVYLAVQNPADQYAFWGIVAASAVLGVLLTNPIGGGDMPVVISLLNSYSGLAACAAGFVVKSNVLIVSGSLVGAAGIILTVIMCNAMNRSLANVIFGAFGAADGGATAGAADEKPMKEFQPMDAAIHLSNARNVIVVPGYGLAVSQAQQSIRELCEYLGNHGCNVKYAIHPVAGRMPGHMNVLLAEANVPYEELYDLDDINGDFESTDVCIVVGANDVTNPSARDDKASPLYGMPVFNCDKSQTVVVLKRGRGKGFAGVQNPLFVADNTGVVFGDAKKSLVSILNEVKQL